MRCLKELEGLRVAKLMCFARRTSTRRPAQCGWRWSREGAKDAKRGCGNGRRLVWPGMCGIGSGGGVTEPGRRSGHPRHSPRRALESLQDAVGNSANGWEPSGFREGFSRHPGWGARVLGRGRPAPNDDLTLFPGVLRITSGCCVPASNRRPDYWVLSRSA